MVKVHFKISIPLVFQGSWVRAPPGAASLPWLMYIVLAILMSKINVYRGATNLMTINGSFFFTDLGIINYDFDDQKPICSNDNQELKARDKNRRRRRVLHTAPYSNA